MALFPQIIAPHPGRPNDLWEWAKATAKLISPLCPASATRFIHEVMCAQFGGIDPALEVAQAYVTLEEPA